MSFKILQAPRIATLVICYQKFNLPLYYDTLFAHPVVLFFLL